MSSEVNKIRGIDDCIEVLEDVADRLTIGTLTAADATAMVRTAEGSAELIELKGEVSKLELDAGCIGITRKEAALFGASAARARGRHEAVSSHPKAGQRDHGDRSPGKEA